MDDEKLLQLYGIKPTALRLLTIKEIRQLENTFSLEELYEYLETVDKSTVFRTITLFEKQGLLHGFEDGFGTRKYCLCKKPHSTDSNESNPNIQTEQEHYTCHHVHISCRICGHTYCLPSEHIPHINIPDGFEVENINYVVTGICCRCRQR